MNMHYNAVEDRLDVLIRYITNCITHREKFGPGAYMSLRKAILRRIEFLEWRYGE